jgi:hypothetical protein
MEPCGLGLDFGILVFRSMQSIWRLLTSDSAFSLDLELVKDLFVLANILLFNGARQLNSSTERVNWMYAKNGRTSRSLISGHISDAAAEIKEERTGPPRSIYHGLKILGRATLD